MQKNNLNALLAEVALLVKPAKLESFMFLRDAIFMEFISQCEIATREGFKDALFSLKAEWEKKHNE